jgi:hypothetical protein
LDQSIVGLVGQLKLVWTFVNDPPADTPTTRMATSPKSSGPPKLLPKTAWMLDKDTVGGVFVFCLRRQVSEIPAQAKENSFQRVFASR